MNQSYESSCRPYVTHKAKNILALVVVSALPLSLHLSFAF